ncbi:hypothetical protein FSP39_001667 [Pinctada imbricata]|uniref:LEM domain-containing protein n=1 Tax=Pinctada imbricata TaxID=66713 RepID=A0AA88YPC9_PINIB|nr:hypothetical protein FSP39_001667 [Pinctada imbricata]
MFSKIQTLLGDANMVKLAHDKYQSTYLMNIRDTNQNYSKKISQVGNPTSHSYSDYKTKSTMAAVEDLTNQELAEELRNLGVSPGPIIASTRRVYEKKLMKLRQSGGGEPLIQKYQPQTYVYQVKICRVLNRSPWADLKRQPDVDHRPNLRNRLQVNQSQQAGGGGGIPMIVKIFLLLLVVFFVYLVIVNMDPSSESNIPKSLPGDEV